MTAQTSATGYDEFDEEPLPQAVLDAKPGEVVTVPDGREKHTVWLDGEMIGVVFDESVAKLERGAFAAWSPKCRNPKGAVGFYGSLEDAADAIAGRPAKPAAETDSKGRRIVTVKGKRYIVGDVVPARPKVEGVPTWVPKAYVPYWSERNGETFGPTRSTTGDAKPGTVGRAIWDAVNP